MATKGIVGYGASIKYGTVTIGEVLSASGGARTAGAVPIFSCDSSDGFVEKLAGALDEGEMSFSIVYDGTSTGTYDKLNTLFLAKTISTWTLTFVDTATYAGSGFISSLGKPSFSAPDQSITIDLGITISGKATYTKKAT